MEDSVPDVGVGCGCTIDLYGDGCKSITHYVVKDLNAEADQWSCRPTFTITTTGSSWAGSWTSLGFSAQSAGSPSSSMPPA
jgi:hypothetical protein